MQHLSPDYESLMPELLARHTRMRVKRAEDGLLVAADTIYLIPPKKNLQIFHGKLLFSDQDRTQGLNLPIDIFLDSLADDQEDKAVAIILSGTGSDGTRGIRTVKGNSGMVMAQDPDNAEFDGMPASAIATGLVDFVLPSEEMPAQLLSFVQHPNLARAEYSHRADMEMNSDALTRIFALLRKAGKVDFTHYKPSTITRRLERRMNLHQISDLRDYAHYLENTPQEVTALYRELLIGVTNFFRDPEVFQTLADHLPALLDQVEGRDVRFWCAGCSTGEEAYTLAMLTREYLRHSGCRSNIKIFATDVDEEAIAQAALGVYPESIVADMGRDLLKRYFTPLQNQRFQVSRELREMVVFARHNLIEDPPFTKIELVSCRNLLIYLEPVLQQRTLDMFNFALNPGGLLMLGSSENIGDHDAYFEVLDSKYKLFRSKGKRKPLGLTQPSLPLLPGKKFQPPLAAIFFEQLKALHADTEKDTKSYDVGAEAEQRISDLEQELQFTRENLQATVEELETSNEELQATNEELLASNEELQSANEELQSVNAEHQRKIIELTELTNDLDNLFAATRIAILFLDENLEIRRFTEETAKLFPLIGKEVGSAFSDLAHGIRHADPNAVAREVLRDGKIQEHEVQAANHHWYLMRITPYNVGADHSLGVVITFTELARQAEALRQSEEGFRGAFDVAPHGMALVSTEGRWLKVNPYLCRLLDYRARELLQTDARSLTHADDRQTDWNYVRDMLAGIIDSYAMPKRYVRKDGGVIRALLSVFLVRDADNRPVHFIFQIYPQGVWDESLPVEFPETSWYYGMALLSLDGRWLRTNPSMRRLLGYSEAELHQMDFQRITHPGDVAVQLRYMQDLRSGKIDSYAMKKRCVHKGGRIIPVQITLSLQRDGDGRPEYFVQYLQPIQQDIDDD